MRAAVYGRRLAVSSCLKSSCLVRWERQLEEQCTSQRGTKRVRLQAPSALSLNGTLPNCPMWSGTGPRFKCINFHPNMIRDRKNLATSSSPANRHTLVAVIHAIHATAIYLLPLANILADQHITHARRTTPKAQPLSFNVPPAQYLWGKAPRLRASLSIYSEFARLPGLRSSKTMRPRFENTPQPLVIAPLKTDERMIASLSFEFCIHATPESCVTLEEEIPSFCAGTAHHFGWTTVL